MKKLLLLAAVCAATMVASAQEYYVIGANVNGKSWALAEPDCLMKAEGDGVYVWKGENLATGFKINDGTWDNPDANFGDQDPATVLALGEPLYYMTGNDSKNITLAADMVNKPTVTLDLNEGTITVTGEAQEVEYTWQLMGSITSWEFDDAPAFVKDGDRYVLTGLEIAEPGTFKLATAGWVKEYGAAPVEAEEPAEGEEPAETPAIINAENLSTTLIAVGGSDVTISITGKWDVFFTPDGDTATVVFADPSAVEGVAAENAPVYYYNLQGVRVDNPSNGIFVKVVGEKAAKVLFNK